LNRLTIRNSDGSVSQPTNLNWAKALERLAEYEDTGLTPDEVGQIKLASMEKGTTEYDLNPCPFCGGRVHFDTSYSYFRDVVIYCDDCDTIFALDDCTAVDSDLVKAWNRRYSNG
jgi:hypothetical protein